MSAPIPPPPSSRQFAGPSAEQTTNLDANDLSSENIIDKLCLSLKQQGDFPTSAKIVCELRRLATDPATTANQITEVILCEPSLGIRLLHIVNSSFYRRSTPIMTVSQAVLRIGMKQLAELCAGLVLLQKFVPAARKNGAFASCLRKAVITPLLTTTISQEMRPITDKKDNSGESGFLAGLFGELGVLLLAFYYPEIYESALKRSQNKAQPVAQSLKEIIGLSPTEISDRILEALALPEYYGKVLSQIDKPIPLKEIKGSPSEQRAIFFTSQSVYAATEISATISESTDKDALDKTLAKLKDSIQLDISGLQKAVGKLPEMFKDHCDSLELDLQEIPTYVQEYNDNQTSESPAVTNNTEQLRTEIKKEDIFTKYFEEIQLAVDNKEPTASIITTVMETLAWGIRFDRVLLLLVDASKQHLKGRMLLGQASVDAKTLSRSTSDLTACDARAFKDGRCIFQGNPVLDEGWPFAAIPIGFGERCVGIIYADRTNAEEADLTSREQAAVGVLAELLNKSIVGNIK
jgi:HD-like signal output (HDOD) protein